VLALDRWYQTNTTAVFTFPLCHITAARTACIKVA